jgi:hypothetical protein
MRRSKRIRTHLCVVNMFLKFFIYLLKGVKDFIRSLNYEKIISMKSMLVCVWRKTKMEEYCIECSIMENG